MSEKEKVLAVYDGECAFCKSWISRWKAHTGDRVVYAPYQDVAASMPDVPAEAFRGALQVFDADGRRASGAEAAFRVLTHAGSPGWLWCYRRVPGFGKVSEAVYAFMARRRPLFHRLTRLGWGDDTSVPSYGLIGRVFLQALGVIYAIAFASLFVQLPGLVGKQGLLPVQGYLEAVQAELGGAGAWFAPTLAWLQPEAGFLQLVALVGAAAAALVIGGILTVPCLVVAWIAYLSLVVAGQSFLSSPWDHLLLEAGFLAIFLAPFSRSATYRSEIDASPRVVWLFRFLLFRLTFGSGVAKLAGGDPAWSGFTALQYHFETQPLPTALAWFAHRLPAGLLSAGTFFLLIVELVIPFLYFFPRRPRLFAAAVTAAAQVAMLLTGNYAFFNWLVLALCLFLLDDAALRRLFRLPQKASAPEMPLHPARRAVLAAVGILIVFLGSLQIIGAFRRPAPFSAVVQAFAPFRIVNDYGRDLFAVMTVQRPEIVIEGSADGETWKEYVFRHKPGDPKRAPGWIAPHQPRLDWQMRFAALGTPEDQPWFVPLVAHLLQGSPDAVSLLAENPFPGKPPAFVRASLYLYRFSTPEERRRDGAWWRREFKAPYLDPAGLAPSP